MTIKTMVCGLPGNVAAIVTRRLLADDQFEVLPYSLTGPEIPEDSYTVEGKTFELIKPDIKAQRFQDIINQNDRFFCIDFTHPSAVNENGSFYCGQSVHFVMGTTGGDRDLLMKTVTESKICAVIAPNMAKQIVGFQAMMEYASQTFKGLFDGYRLEIVESHQNGKADTSGTAKAMVKYFNAFGIEFAEDRIQKIRDPELQKNDLGIPEQYIGGHGWHTYRLTSPDETVSFTFKHNVNGREIYAEGTVDALKYLDNRVREGETGKVFSMIDVLKG